MKRTLSTVLAIVLAFSMSIYGSATSAPETFIVAFDDGWAEVSETQYYEIQSIEDRDAFIKENGIELTPNEPTPRLYVAGEIMNTSSQARALGTWRINSHNISSKTKMSYYKPDGSPFNFSTSTDKSFYAIYRISGTLFMTANFTLGFEGASNISTPYSKVGPAVINYSYYPAKSGNYTFYCTNNSDFTLPVNTGSIQIRNT